MFKRHGRWRSESAKDGYVNDTVERSLYVSKGFRYKGTCPVLCVSMLCCCHGVHQVNANTNVGHWVGWVAITMQVGDLIRLCVKYI